MACFNSLSREPGEPRVANRGDRGTMGSTRHNPTSFPHQGRSRGGRAVSRRSKRGAKYQAQAQLDTVKAKVVPLAETAQARAREGATLVAERVGPSLQAARESAVPAAQSAAATAREK